MSWISKFKGHHFNMELKKKKKKKEKELMGVWRMQANGSIK